MKGNQKSNRGDTSVNLIASLFLGAVLIGAAFLLFPVFARSPGSSLATRVLSHVKQIGIGTIIYIADYDEVYPPVQSQVTYQSLVNPYIKNMAYFTDFQSEHNVDIRFNTRLSNVELTNITKPVDTVVLTTPFHETPKSPVKHYTVGFADGGAKNIKPVNKALVFDALDWNFPRVSQDFYPPGTVVP